MRRKQRVGTSRPRRGATLVFVAVFAVALVGLAVFAVDVSRLYVGANELQTGADAAALRGALHLQRYPTSNPTAETIRFAKVNEALGDSVRLSSSDVLGLKWAPDSARDYGRGFGSGANAVEVHASRAGSLLFGRLLSAIVSPTQRNAIAWVANVTRISCPTPWGFPLASLNQKLYGASNTLTSVTLYADLVAKLAAQNGPRDLTVFFVPPTQAGKGKTPPLNGTSGYYQAITDDKNVNMNSYRDQVANPSTHCGANASVGISNETENFSGEGSGTVQKKTPEAAFGLSNATSGSLCAQAVGTSDCWPRTTVSFSGANPGVEVSVAWLESTTGASSKALTIGGFRVMCIIRDEDKKQPSAQSCAWADGANRAYFTGIGVPAVLPEGTIVGYPVTTAPGLGQGTSLGNAPSLGQRLILVR